MVRSVAYGRFRASLRGAGLNLVDVRDVARGHLLALERGRAGERYLLGGVDLPLRELFEAVADLAGVARPCAAREPQRGAPRARAGVVLVGEGRARARLQPRPRLAGARARRARGA